LAEEMISRKRFGVLTGWDRGYVYRRLNGDTPLDIADLEHIEHTVGVAVNYLVAEIGPRRIGVGNPRHPGDGISSHVDANDLLQQSDDQAPNQPVSRMAA
jgi:hypothetical protein